MVLSFVLSCTLCGRSEQQPENFDHKEVSIIKNDHNVLSSTACLEAALGSCLLYGECPHNHVGSYIPINLAIGSHWQRECAKLAFDRWFCGLKPRVGPVRRMERTISKTMFLTAKQMVEEIMLGRRFVEDLTLSRRDWKWIPRGKVHCWMSAESCSNKTNMERYQSDPVRATAQHFGSTFSNRKVLSPDKTSHTLGLWRAGQLVRYISSALGPCGQRAVDELTVTFVRESKIHILNNSRVDDTVNELSSVLDVAMHIRRGDACKRYASEYTSPSNTKFRLCYPVSAYVTAIRKLYKRYGSSQQQSVLRVRLASDSPSVITELTKLLEETDIKAEVLYVNFDRINVGGHENATLGAFASDSRMYIEHRPGVDFSLAFASLYAELRLLSKATFFVGTAESAFSRLLLLNLIGHLGAIPPFLFVDQNTFLRGDGALWVRAFDVWLAHAYDLREIALRLRNHRLPLITSNELSHC